MHVHHVIRDAVEFVFATALFINALLFIPQTVKIFKEKDGREISLITFGGFLFIQFTILLHGIIEHDSLLIIGYLLSIIACGSVVFSALLFRKHDDVLATSNKKSKAELEEEVNMLENIIAMMPGHVYWIDQKGTYLGCNDLMAKSAGLSSKKEIIGKTNYDLPWNSGVAFIPERLNKVNLEVMNSGKSIMLEESRTVERNTTITFLSSKTPLYNKDDRVVGMVGVSIDITSKKEAELAEKQALLAQEEINKLKYERDLDLIRSEAHKNKIMQEFGIIAAKVAHDISSPLMVANSSLNKLKEEFTPDNQNINLIQQSLQDIRNISGKILSTYRKITAKENKVNLQKVDDGSIKRYVLLSSLLENQINMKKIEWQENPCDLKLTINDDARNIFAYIAPLEFNRSISNLLNNAYDSLGIIYNRNIIVELNSNNNKFILRIKDSGSGIAEEKQAKVLSGESTKHEGNGMGLSGAKAYFESNAGKLELMSIVNSGTEITVELPTADDPSWFERTINCTPDITIAILDDSSTIIMLWQRTLSDLNLKGNYFMNVEDFIKWYKNQEDRKNIILFVDYDLGNQDFTGLDIIKQVNDIRAYLVTNHAEEFWLQDIVQQNNLKLLPKKVIEELVFI